MAKLTNFPTPQENRNYYKRRAIKNRYFEKPKPTKDSANQVSRKGFSTHYLTARGNSAGIIEVNYIPADEPVITSAMLRILPSDQSRNITHRVRGKLETDILSEITAYESLVADATREAYGEMDYSLNTIN